MKTPESQSNVTMDLSRICVLVVDDSQNIRNIVTEILRTIGIRNVKQSSGGIEAFEILKIAPVDLIILDLVMDQLDGVETAKLLRQSSDSPGRYIPIIMITGHSVRENVTRARDAGVNEIIAKPFTAQTLIDHIRIVMRSKREWIAVQGYAGPDRRRKTPADYGGPFRRSTDGQSKGQNLA